MLTPSFDHLFKSLTSFLSEHNKLHDDIPVVLNIGAGSSVLIERWLHERGLSFICDRVELENIKVTGFNIRDCYECSVESMEPVRSGEYDIVFAKYVLEHIQHIDSCASEIYRVLKPGGIFITSIPNPTAPEILFARITPLWFHKLIVDSGVYKTYYAFKDMRELTDIFNKNKFDRIDIFYRSCLLSYLEHFPVLNKLAFLYDKTINYFEIKRFMSNVCVAFKKTE